MFDLLDIHTIYMIASYLSCEDILDLSLCCNRLYRILYNKQLHINCMKNKQKRNTIRRDVHNTIRRVKDTIVLKGICSICQTNGLLFEDRLSNSINFQLKCIDNCRFPCLFCEQRIRVSCSERVEPVLCRDCIAYYG